MGSEHEQGLAVLVCRARGDGHEPDALRTAKLELERQGFDELLEQRDKRRREQRARTRARKTHDQAPAPDRRQQAREPPKQRRNRKH